MKLSSEGVNLMSGELFGTKERLGKVIDKFTEKEIIYLSLLSILAVNLILYLCVILPMSNQLDRSMIESDIYLQNIRSIESKNQKMDKVALRSLELADSLSLLRTIYASHSLEVEEILISQLPTESSGFGQAAVKVTILGDKGKVLQALAETQTIINFPYLVQEINIDGQRAIIDYKILYVKA